MRIIHVLYPNALQASFEHMEALTMSPDQADDHKGAV